MTTETEKEVNGNKNVLRSGALINVSEAQ